MRMKFNVSSISVLVMDSIAFAFCDAVVGTIKDLRSLYVPFPDAKWHKALQDHFKNRKCFQLNVGFYGGKWSYSLFKGSNALLTTLVQQVDPKYLRIDCIDCVGHGWSVIETSKEELHVLIASLQPFLNFPKLRLSDGGSAIPEGDLAELLSSFAKINICSFYSSRNATEFAKKLMQQDTLLKEITMRDEQNALADEIADYQATGRLVHVTTNRFPVYETSLRFVR